MKKYLIAFFVMLLVGGLGVRYMYFMPSERQEISASATSTDSGMVSNVTPSRLGPTSTPGAETNVSAEDTNEGPVVATNEGAPPVLDEAMPEAVFVPNPVIPTPVKYEPLSQEEKAKYTDRKDRSEAKIKDIMKRFSENLSDHEKRAELEGEMKTEIVAYKQSMLKLGKEMLHEEKN